MDRTTACQPLPLGQPARTRPASAVVRAARDRAVDDPGQTSTDPMRGRVGVFRRHQGTRPRGSRRPSCRFHEGCSGERACGSLLSERNRSGGSAQGRCAPAGAGRLRRSWRRPAGPAVGGGRSGRRNGARGRTKERRQGKPAGGRLLRQGSVRPDAVVMIEPRGQRGGALVRGRVGCGRPCARRGSDSGSR